MIRFAAMAALALMAGSAMADGNCPSGGCVPYEQDGEAAALLQHARAKVKEKNETTMLQMKMKGKTNDTSGLDKMSWDGVRSRMLFSEGGVHEWFPVPWNGRVHVYRS